MVITASDSHMKQYIQTYRPSSPPLGRFKTGLSACSVRLHSSLSYSPQRSHRDRNQSEVLKVLLLSGATGQQVSAGVSSIVCYQSLSAVT